MHRTLSIIVLWCLHILAFPQSRGFIAYSVQDGLAQSNVIDMAEDHLGNLWLATTGGLSKFNGLEFDNFKKQDGLVSNQIYCITVDLEGNVWIGTNKGVSYFDGHKFTNYSVPSLDRDQYINNIIADQQGRIWFSTTSGKLSTLMEPTRSAEVTVRHSFDEKIGGLVTADSSIWIATLSGDIYRYDYQRFHKIFTGAELGKQYVTALYMDQTKHLWFGSNRGLYKLQNGEAQFMHSFHSDDKKFHVYSICEESPGTMWVGTTNGAYRYNNGTCTPVNAADGLTDNIIYKIHKDREGTLWFGSFGGGFYKSLGGLFTRLDKGHGLSFDYISSICRGADNDYWFGSYGGGVFHYSPPGGPGSKHDIQKLAHEDGLSNDFVYQLTQSDENTLWIATAYGLNKYHKGKLTCYYTKDGLASSQIFSLLKSREGSMYCGTSMGLTLINPDESFTNFQYPGERHHNRVRTLVETKDGNLLLGTHGGLKVFDGKTITDYFQIDSLKHWPISTVYQDENGVVWCALRDDGILKYDPATANTSRITEEHGLSSNIVYSLTMDQLGSLWAGTPHGLDKIRFDADGQVLMVRNFGSNEGFFGIETNTNAVLAEPEGAIWFGTVKGVYKCSPWMEDLNALEPITNVTGIRLFSQHVEWNQVTDSTQGWYDLPVDLRLEPNQNHLTFDFFGNSLKNPDKVTYQYTLENFDRDWQPVTTNNTAVYTNLPPGKYSFKVRASNGDGVWNEKAASFSFEIVPPFWRTWWFFTLVVVALSVAGRLYYNLRVQQKLKSLIQVEQLKNEEVIKVRRRVAEDFHDQVGNQLASITVLVQLIQARLSSGNLQVEELLSKLGQFTKTLFTGTRDFIWSIDPKSDNVSEMLIYIRDFGEELFEYSEVNFHVETNNSFDAKLKLPVGWSRHVVFIFKEALTNSLKHAHCKNVYLSFNVSDHNFVFELKDDGVGLNGHKEGDYPGMGLQNMKERAKKIGGEIIIDSSNGKGTVVTLEGKIPQNTG